MGRFETKWLAAEKNLSALADLSGQWIGRVHDRRRPRGVVLDMDSSVSPTHREQKMSVWNAHAVAIEVVAHVSSASIHVERWGSRWGTRTHNSRHHSNINNLTQVLVGVRGFEPPTPSSRTRCATRLRYTPTPAGRCPAVVSYSGAILGEQGRRWPYWRPIMEREARQSASRPGHWRREEAPISCRPFSAPRFWPRRRPAPLPAPD